MRVVSVRYSVRVSLRSTKPQAFGYLLYLAYTNFAREIKSGTIIRLEDGSRNIGADSASGTARWRYDDGHAVLPLIGRVSWGFRFGAGEIMHPNTTISSDKIAHRRRVGIAR